MTDSKNLIGTVFDIQGFSVHDGPGIRTLVFMKGCPLRCKWCSNPEGLSRQTDIRFKERLCINCGACETVCPTKAISFEKTGGYSIDRELCIRCGKCAAICPTKAKIVEGRVYTVDELTARILKDKAFVTNGKGGVTVGGGEMLLQHEFVEQLLKKLKELEIHTAVETTGFAKTDDFLNVIKHADYIMIDLKAIDANLHKKLTGIDNKQILNNIICLDRFMAEHKDKTYVIRIPLIKGYNDSKENINQTIKFIKENLAAYDHIELLPFHNFGESKYEELGLKYELKGVSNTPIEEVEPVRDRMLEAGLKVKINTW